MSFGSQFTDTQAASITALADAYRAGNLVLRQDLQSLAQQYLGEFRGSQVPQQVQIASGVATFERLGKITYLVIDTEGGGLPTDDLDTFAISGPAQPVFGDLVIVKAASAARTWRITGSGNVSVKAGTLPIGNPANSCAILMAIDATSFVEVARYPEIQQTAMTSQTCYIVSDAIVTDSQICQCVSLTGETLATATITYTAGSDGSVDIWVDQGIGSFIIGSVENVDPSWTTSDWANAMETAINAGTSTHGYTATSPGNQNIVTTPMGSGSAGSGYSIYTVVSGTVTTSTPSFSGGSDGMEQDSDLDTITGGTDGPLFIYNAMTANDITLISGASIVGASLPFVIGPKETKMLVKIGSNYSLSI